MAFGTASKFQRIIYFESFFPFSNREKTKVLNRLKLRLIKM